MNLEEYNFNVPSFVAGAPESCFDVTSEDAVVVGGYRIDNPPAAWVAGAAIRKSASAIESSVCRMVKQACDLFGITEDMYVPVAVNPTVSVSDGEHTADFCVFDSESLNKAASALLDERRNIPYSFAHDCAVALQTEAVKQGLSFNDDIVVPIRKLAGDYNVDFEAGRKLLESATAKAESLGMSEHATVLGKIASMCTSECTPSAAPYFIAALDEFYTNAPGMLKSASADCEKLPEDVFYLSTAEYKDVQDRTMMAIDSSRSISRGSVRKAASAISSWAATCGYSIALDSTPEQVAAQVSTMPSALREEFIELFA